MIEVDNQAHLALRATEMCCSAEPVLAQTVDDASEAPELPAPESVPAGSFEKIMRLATRVLDAPAAVISLIHGNRIWYQSFFGIAADADATRILELEFSSSLTHSCAVELPTPNMRKLDHPRILGGHAVRCYVTVPLIGRNGDQLGVLHVVGTEALQLDEFETAVLLDIAAIAVDEIELHFYSLLTDDITLPREPSRRTISGVRSSKGKIAKPRKNRPDNEEDYQSLIGLLSDWHWEQDERGRFILIAETGEMRTPEKFRQYIGKTISQIPGMRIAQQDWQALGNAIDRHQSFQEAVFQWQDANNVLRYLSVSGQPMFNAQGRFRGYRGVIKDVTEKILFQKELARSNAALRELSEAQQAFREAERKRIARELHDELAQLLASSRMELCLLQRDLQVASLSHQRLDAVDKMIGSSILSLRKLATVLRPSSLDEGGLYYALRALLRTVSENAGIECHLLADEAELTMDERLSTTIFRLVEECLNNVVRHANAHKAVVQIYRSGNSVEIRVQDDGRGIRQEETRKAKVFGLMEMRERVQKMKGEIDIKGLPGDGTCIAISLPQP